MTIHVRLLVALALALLIGLAAPAQSERPCTHACQTRLTVGNSVQRWHSAQGFRASDTLLINLYARGHRLNLGERRHCAGYFYGHGTVAKVNTCRRPIRVRYVTVARKPMKLRITYRLLP